MRDSSRTERKKTGRNARKKKIWGDGQKVPLSRTVHSISSMSPHNTAWQSQLVKHNALLTLRALAGRGRRICGDHEPITRLESDSSKASCTLMSHEPLFQKARNVKDGMYTTLFVESTQRVSVDVPPTRIPCI